MEPDVDVMGVLAAARQIEVFGIEFYRRFSECVRDERGAALLRGLGRDEGQHMKELEREMKALSPGTDPASVIPVQTMLGIAPGEAFPFPTDRCLNLEDEIKALEIGIQVEVRSVKMYRDAASLVKEPSVKALLERLATMEEGHRKLLEDNMRMLRNEGAWYGYSPILEG